MSEIIILEAALHRIDIHDDEMGSALNIGNDTDFNSYVTDLMDDIYESPRYKAFKFKSLTSEVSIAISPIQREKWDIQSAIIAKRLHKTEKDKQEKYEKLTTFRTGSLLQLLVSVDEKISLIITKVDHDAYLNENNLKEQFGLPKNKKSQKTAIIGYEDDETISEIRISDSNTKISEYWYSDFLEAEELQSSEKNTNLSFDSIDQSLRRNLKSKYKSDFWTLRNGVISYYRSNTHFVFNDLIKNVFSSYKPYDNNLDMDVLIDKISDLPKKHNFDTQFELSPIKAKIKEIINLTKNLDLQITGEIENFPSTFTTGEETNGRKYLKIYSDKGYNEFNKKLEAEKTEATEG